MLRFEMTGRYFSFLPEGAVVVASSDNDNPLQERYSTSPYYALPITVIDDNHLVAEGVIVRYSSPRYAGAILSADREGIFYVNDTRPLP